MNTRAVSDTSAKPIETMLVDDANGLVDSETAAILEPDAAGWRDQRYTRDWLSSLICFAVPHLGHLSVGGVTSADVVETLQPVWHARPSTAQRVRQRIGSVMEWAVAMAHRDDNP